MDADDWCWHRRLAPSTFRRATPFKVVVADWGRRVAVSVEPCTVDRPTVCFLTAAEAMTFAEGLAKVEGWRVEDRLR